MGHREQAYVNTNVDQVLTLHSQVVLDVLSLYNIARQLYQKGAQAVGSDPRTDSFGFRQHNLGIGQVVVGAVQRRMTSQLRR